MNLKNLSLASFICLFSACSKSDDVAEASSDIVINVDKTKFLAAGLSEPITIVLKTLSTEATVDCYKIVTKSTPTDHNIGQWCPSNQIYQK